MIVNLDSLPAGQQKSCIANIEENVKILKSYIEENILAKENLAEVPETGMAVLQQQLVLVQAIESWISSVKEKIDTQ